MQLFICLPYTINYTRKQTRGSENRSLWHILYYPKWKPLTCNVLLYRNIFKKLYTWKITLQIHVVKQKLCCSLFQGCQSVLSTNPEMVANFLKMHFCLYFTSTEASEQNFLKSGNFLKTGISVLFCVVVLFASNSWYVDALVHTSKISHQCNSIYINGGSIITYFHH